MPLFPGQFLLLRKNVGRSVEDAFLPAYDNTDWERTNWVNCAGRRMLDLSRSGFAHCYIVGTRHIAVEVQKLIYAQMELLGLLPTEKPCATSAMFRNPYDQAVS
jgi:hypothetical protein